MQTVVKTSHTLGAALLYAAVAPLLPAIGLMHLLAMMETDVNA